MDMIDSMGRTPGGSYERPRPRRKLATHPTRASRVHTRARPGGDAANDGGYDRTMWEAPSRDRGTPEPGGPNGGGGDALGGAPDSSRPANPWPRLLAFAAVVLTMVVLAGTCLVSYARPPERELRLNVTEFNLGVPKFVPVTTFGADRDGFTYGAWITVSAGGRASALLSRDPASGCHVRWEATLPADGSVGAFVDRCSNTRYGGDGAALDHTAARGMDVFPAHANTREVTVSVASVTLGSCRTGAHVACSTAERPDVRSMPKNALPLDFGRK